MRAPSPLARFLIDLLLLVLGLVLVPVRLAAVLIGSGLTLAGSLGLPAWVIQLVVSATEGSDARGPLPAWLMCALLVAAIPAGIVILQVARAGLDPATGAFEELGSPIEDTTFGKTAGQPLAFRRSPPAELTLCPTAVLFVSRSVESGQSRRDFFAMRCACALRA